jgi:phage head maturation protease
LEYEFRSICNQVGEVKTAESEEMIEEVENGRIEGRSNGFRNRPLPTSESRGIIVIMGYF